MATARRAHGTRRKPPAALGRLLVNVTSPDDAQTPRGLRGWLVQAAPSGARGEVVVALVSDARMRTLNRSFRGHNYATDVLSFPAVRRADALASAAAGGLTSAAAKATALRTPAFLGDIVIAAGVARRQADEAGHSLSTELKILALHGLLHLLGYDHERDAGEMAALEERLRRRAGLGAGLIARQRR